MSCCALRPTNAHAAHVGRSGQARTRDLVGAFLAVTLTAVSAGVVAATVLVPRLGGGTPYTVLTGSMRPSLPPGTLVVVRPAAPEEIGIGSVITYQLRSGEPAVVTHRVVGVGSNGKEMVYRTQGDANSAADPVPVREVQVRGRLWYAVPHLGRANEAMSGNRRELVTYGAVAALLGYAAIMFAGALRDRRVGESS